MIITIDTSEQKPLDFDGLEGVESVVRMNMDHGDYGAIIHGKQVPVIFERKALNDLFGTMTQGYDRYKREMQRAKDAGNKLILIIEGSYVDVWDGIAHSQFTGESMMKKLATLYVKYDHEYVFCENRRVMARRITDVFSAIERNYSV